MASKFITNSDLLVSEMIANIIPSTESMYFLVGYFYFSGFEQVYRAVGDKPLRILVGMDVERDISGAIKEYELRKAETDQGQKTSRAEVRERFSQGLVSVINETDHFDSPEREEAFRFFLHKLQTGTLEIRKTADPNHAKLYLFQNLPSHAQGGTYPGTVLTGSSNLTYSGLSDRYEVNVVLRDENDYKDGKAIFDELWKKAIPIADASTKDRFAADVVEHVWLEKLPSPYSMYIRVLSELFDSRAESILLPSEITEEKYFNIRYQTDAIRAGISIIGKHSGCIVADVVGLGKSIVASAIAYNLGLKVVIVAPPHLVPQWEDYAFEFGLSARVYSLGKMDEALDQNKDAKDLIIIVDEAHRFRNEATIDYGVLHKLCQGNKVMLLSATPYNNRPQDIFSLIKLFQIPAKATIQTVDNLAAEIHSLIEEYKKLKREQLRAGNASEELRRSIEALSARIRDILAPLVIRRTRVDLEAIDEYREDLAAQGISFPTVRDPEEIDYELGPLSDLYIATLERICPETQDAGFIGARYKPFLYLLPGTEKKYLDKTFVDENFLEQSQTNLAAFMKRLLVRRFESSIAAFRKTLDSMITSSSDLIAWYERFGKVPLYKKGKLPDFDTLSEMVDDDLNALFQESLDDILASALSKELARGMVLIDREDLSPDFLADVHADLDLLKSIRMEWSPDQVRSDPKLDAFSRVLERSLAKEPERKLVVFSEFADTVDYLGAELKKRKLRVMTYSAADASKAKKNAVIANFDASFAQARNDYDVIVATDAISEGFNLHRAGIVFNYDIPYNPTRVIQRVGRINRINLKVFDELRIYNFFPSATGEYVTHAKAVSTFKLALIQAILGEDTKVLSADEETKSYFAARYRSALAEAEQASWDSGYLNLLNGLKKNQSEILEAAGAIPRRARVRRNEERGASGVILFAKKGGECRFTLADRAARISSLSPEAALPLFEAARDEKGAAVSESFALLYAKAKRGQFASVPATKVAAQSSEAGLKAQALTEALGDSGEREYVEDLARVIEELGSLPEVYQRFLRDLDIKNPQAAARRLEAEIPAWYVARMLKRASDIGAEPEELILSEELI